MTQISRFWDGTSVGDATDAPYDAATEFARVMQSVSAAGGVTTNRSAVFRGELNELAVTGAVTPVSINTGRAITAGTWYENDAAVTLAVATPAVSTRIDRVVLRKTWSAAVQTVRLTLIVGVEGGAAPALVQIWGTTWDQPLAQVSITIGGAITLTDQREFVGYFAFAVPGASAVGDVAAAGVATTIPRSDHTHGREAFAAPAALAPGGTAVTGVATTIPHSDHVHAITVPKARVFNTGNVSTLISTLTAMLFDSERYDNDAIHDTATNTGRLTCKTAGTYDIKGCIDYATAVGTYRDLGIRLNGATYICFRRQPHVVSLGAILEIATTYDLAVNDYVELIARQDAGTVDVLASANYSPEFSMEKVG